MPPVITSIGCFKQSLTGGAFEALAACTADSLTVIAFPDGSNAYVEEIWSGNSAHKMSEAASTRSLRLSSATARRTFSASRSTTSFQPRCSLPLNPG